MGLYQKRKTRKYKNIPCEADGIRFDSKKERARYYELKTMQANNHITGLQVHPSFPLILPNGKHVAIRSTNRTTKCRYTADFLYYENGTQIVEDVKSLATMTTSSKLRIAIFEAIYNTEVRIA